MSRVYTITIVLLGIFFAKHDNEASNSIALPILIFVISFYSLYRHSTVYQRFRFNDNRYFLKSQYDKPYTNKKLYLGITFLLTGSLFYIYKSHFGLSTHFNSLITWSLAAFGLTNILSRLFFTASPNTEIVINKNSVEIYRMANLIREFHEIKDFKINQKSIILESDKKIFELVDLELSEELQVHLKDEFTILKNHLNESTQRQKQAYRRIRNFLGLKRH